MKYVSGKTGGTWKCTAKCKELTQFEVDTVLEFKSYVTGSRKRYTIAHIIKIELLASRDRVSSQL